MNLSQSLNLTKRRILYKINLALFVAIIVLFNACASMGDVEKLDTLYYKNNNLEDSYKYAKKYAKDDFLWAFQSGILAYQTGDFDASTKYFNISETFFETNSEENFLQSGLKTLSSILVANSMFEYHGNLYEAVFINYYKALNAIMIGDYATSRVEFNRANDRQRRSKDFFAERISKVRDAIEDETSVYNKEMTQVNGKKTNDSIDSIYVSHYKNLHQFQAYEGYVNPIVSYVSGIFFLMQNDFNKANDLLKEAYAISTKKEILFDLGILEKRKSNKTKEFYTWIIIEDGRSPKKHEIRLDVPLYLLDSNILYFGIALPNLDSGKSYNNKYSINTDMTYSANSMLANSFEVGNMESIIANEFSIEIPYIIMTSIISASYKAYLQYFLNKQFGGLAGLGGAIFNILTNSADIRNSRILPLRFLVMRIKNTDDIFYVFGDKKTIFSFSIDEKCTNLCLNKDNIVYLRVLQNDIISSLTHSIGENK